MEENTTLETKKMPGFLKVLCILSFIGVGISIIMSIVGYVGLSALSSMSSTLSSFSEGTEMNTAVSSMDALIKNGALYYILLIVAALVCLVGVIMMWKLKKTGFYIYVIGEIAPIILPFVLLGGFGVLGTMALIMGMIFPIAFIIMYALNLKHMS